MTNYSHAGGLTAMKKTAAVNNCVVTDEVTDDGDRRREWGTASVVTVPVDCPWNLCNDSGGKVRQRSTGI